MKDYTSQIGKALRAEPERKPGLLMVVISELMGERDAAVIAAQSLVDWVQEGRNALSDPEVGINQTPTFCCVCDPLRDGIPDGQGGLLLDIHGEGCPVPLAEAVLGGLTLDKPVADLQPGIMMRDEDQAVVLTRLEIATKNIIEVLEIMNDPDSARTADLGILPAIREVYATAGRYVPEMEAPAQVVSVTYYCAKDGEALTVICGHGPGGCYSCPNEHHWEDVEGDMRAVKVEECDRHHYCPICAELSPKTDE